MRFVSRTLTWFHRKVGILKFRWEKLWLDQLELAHRGENVRLMPPGKIIRPQNVSVHDHVYIGPGFWISAVGRLNVGSGVIVGPRLKVYTANHNYEHPTSLPYDATVIERPVRIGDNCWIGGDVILLPGVELGEGCVVGAGSVVTKSFPPGAILGGNPARILKQRDMGHYNALKQEDMVYLRQRTRGNSDDV